MKHRYLSALAGIGCAALLCVPSLALAQSSLGAAESFAVLGGSTVTNTGPSTVNGNLGVYPGSALVGFPPGTIVNGTSHVADAVALAAQGAVTTLYNSLASQPCPGGNDLTGQDLGTVGALIPGVYCFPGTSAGLTGTLTLDAQGDPGAVWVFQIGSTLTTASSSSVSFVSGVGSPCNVFWQVGSSATLGTTTQFAGNILAMASITLNTGATIDGRALARTGATTLDTNVVDRSMCQAPCPPITILPATLPQATVGVAYSQLITGSGGTAPYTFIRTSGTLPPGLTLATGGLLSGTPTTAGSYTFTVQGTDANGCFAERTYTMSVSDIPCPPITILPATLPPASVGVPYTQQFTGQGGTPPYTFTVPAGTLPRGLRLTPAGVLSGTPNLAGSYTFIVRGTDANGCFAERRYTMDVDSPVPTMSQWLLMLLALGLMGLGYLRLHRRSLLQ